MIILNENTRKIAKGIGIFFLIIFLYGVFNLFTGGDKMNLEKKSNSSFMGSSVAQEDSVSREIDYTTPESELGMNFDGGSIKEGENIQDKKIIKNGNLNLKVKEIEKAVEDLEKIVESKGGEVFSTNFYNLNSRSRSGSVVVKVPVEKFEESVEEIKKISTQVLSAYTSGDDVTEQYVDLEAQLKNKKAEESAFLKILDQSGEVEDVLMVTKELARVRGEIERLEAKLRYLNSQVEMSTIDVSLSEDAEIVSGGEDWRIGQVIKNSVNELISSLQEFTNGFIRFIIVGVPLIVLIFLFIRIVYVFGKKIYKKINLK